MSTTTVRGAVNPLVSTLLALPLAAAVVAGLTWLGDSFDEALYRAVAFALALVAVRFVVERLSLPWGTGQCIVDAGSLPMQWGDPLMLAFRLLLPCFPPAPDRCGFPACSLAWHGPPPVRPVLINSVTTGPSALATSSEGSESSGIGGLEKSGGG